MRSGQPPGYGRPTFQPLGTAGGSVLSAKIVASVAKRREEHFRVALRANHCIEALKGNAAVQDSTEESIMIGRGSDIVLLSITGSHRLWIEEFRLQEIGVLWADVQCRGNNLFRSKDEVELGEGIQRLDLGFIVREWQRPAGLLLVEELKRSVEVDALVNQRPAQHAPRRFISNATHMITADTKVR